MLSNVAARNRFIGDEPTPRVRADATGITTIALVNNMKAGGFDAAERQFAELVALGASGAPCRLRRFTLHDAAQLDGRRRLDDELYEPFERIWGSGVEGVIITGAEPCHEDLRDEPYWPRLTELLDWADLRRIPVLLSCLAAHAAVLHWDGIRRQRLPEKRSGVFRQRVVSDHPLMRDIASPSVPHSRWNELDASALSACGYTILTRSEEAGVDAFVRQGRTMAIGLQGHPEYEPETLLLEYKRDVRRFLTGATTCYPKLPSGYFSPDEIRRLERFRIWSCAEPAAALAATFPVDLLRQPFAASWHNHAAQLFGNWLSYVREVAH